MPNQNRSCAAEVLFLMLARITRPFFSTLYEHCREEVHTTFGREVRPVLSFLSREIHEFEASK
jgi:hypothetical protein